jgi:hypothetical protein
VVAKLQSKKARNSVGFSLHTLVFLCEPVDESYC